VYWLLGLNGKNGIISMSFKSISTNQLFSSAFGRNDGFLVVDSPKIAIYASGSPRLQGPTMNEYNHVFFKRLLSPFRPATSSRHYSPSQLVFLFEFANCSTHFETDPGHEKIFSSLGSSKIHTISQSFYNAPITQLYG
jgi:hypothetical protein